MKKVDENCKRNHVLSSLHLLPHKKRHRLGDTDFNSRLSGRGGEGKQDTTVKKKAEKREASHSFTETSSLAELRQF